MAKLISVGNCDEVDTLSWLQSVKNKQLPGNWSMNHLSCYDIWREGRQCIGTKQQKLRLGEHEDHSVWRALGETLEEREKERVEGGHGARGNENVELEMQASFPGLLGI